MSFHPEILEGNQARILRQLGPVVSARNFHLAGGTALALILGHRRSIDFDWFTTSSMDDPLRLAAELRDAGIPFTADQVDRGTLHGRVEGVQVTFLEYRYPLLAEPLFWEEYGCPLLALDDIACMKLSAITQRGARKDFIDLYALVREHRDLAALLELYRRKFEIEDPGHVLFALAYFEDADQEPMPEMLWNVDWLRIKESIRGWLREVAG